jgi:tRNA dimethylallyltransferase
MDFSQKNIKRLIVIEGPTASGKTALSVAVASHFKTIILSADSRQFYREMSIGTAKPTFSEMQGIKHYFIDSHSVENELTAATFAKEANEVLRKEFENYPIIVLTGGSGMYVNALCNGLDNIPVSMEERKKLNTEYNLNGINTLLNELEILDPLYFSRVDKANPMRLIRALEVIRATGKPYSSFINQKRPKAFFEVVRFEIQHPRAQLYERIEKRVDEMIRLGLLDEVKSLQAYRMAMPLKTVGYRELFDYLDGKIDFQHAVELIKQHTRNYAKRQVTWLRKNSHSVAIPFSAIDEMSRLIVKNILTHDIRNYKERD